MINKREFNTIKNVLERERDEKIKTELQKFENDFSYKKNKIIFTEDESIKEWMHIGFHYKLSIFSIIEYYDDEINNWKRLITNP